MYELFSANVFFTYYDINYLKKNFLFNFFATALNKVEFWSGYRSYSYGGFEFSNHEAYPF